VHQSGESTRSGSITKEGSSALRSVLVQAGHVLLFRCVSVEARGTQTVDIQSDTIVGAEIWAGNAKVLWESDTTVFGSIFAGDFEATSDFKLHYDNAVAQVGSNCPPPPGTGDGGTSSGGDGGGGGSCGSCMDCGNQACINGACSSCSSSAQCCPPLVCQSGSCVSLTPPPR
jgi:hypothetical protein